MKSHLLLSIALSLLCGAVALEHEGFSNHRQLRLVMNKKSSSFYSSVSRVRGSSSPKKTKSSHSSKVAEDIDNSSASSEASSTRFTESTKAPAPSEESSKSMMKMKKRKSSKSQMSKQIKKVRGSKGSKNGIQMDSDDSWIPEPDSEDAWPNRDNEDVAAATDEESSDEPTDMPSTSPTSRPTLPRTPSPTPTPTIRQGDSEDVAGGAGTVDPTPVPMMNPTPIPSSAAPSIASTGNSSAAATSFNSPVSGNQVPSVSPVPTSIDSCDPLVDPECDDPPVRRGVN
jgi:hypothetical protein